MTYTKKERRKTPRNMWLPSKFDIKMKLVRGGTVVLTITLYAIIVMLISPEIYNDDTSTMYLISLIIAVLLGMTGALKSDNWYRERLRKAGKI